MRVGDKRSRPSTTRHAKGGMVSLDATWIQLGSLVRFPVNLKIKVFRLCTNIQLTISATEDKFAVSD
jgi:hypothetical protein